MTDQEKILTDENYIGMKKYDFSLEKLLQRFPDGCPDHIIANALKIKENEVEINYLRIINFIKEKLNV